MSRASVCADGVETPYLRIGRGPSVILLRDGVIDNPRNQTILQDLAGAYTVIVPEIPLDQPAPLEKLLGVLQGLGIRDVVLLADVEWSAIAASAFSSTDQVRGVATLLHNDGTSSIKAAGLA